jgi:hypothetical protein
VEHSLEVELHDCISEGSTREVALHIKWCSGPRQEHSSVRAILPVFSCKHNRNTYLHCKLTHQGGNSDSHTDRARSDIARSRADITLQISPLSPEKVRPGHRQRSHATGAPHREPQGVTCVWPTLHQRILTTPSYGSLVKCAAAGPTIISLMLDRATALPPLISI